MSYHDIYGKNRERTGLKFSDKTSNLRSEDEYSLNVRGFVGFDDFVFLKRREDGILYPLTTLLQEGETSIMAFERIVYNAFGFDIFREKAKLMASKTESNDFFDYWLYREPFDYNEEDLAARNIVKVKYSQLEEIEENGEYFEVTPDKIVHEVFGIIMKPTTRPLIRKSNVL